VAKILKCFHKTQLLFFLQVSRTQDSSQIELELKCSCSAYGWYAKLAVLEYCQWRWYSFLGQFK